MAQSRTSCMYVVSYQSPATDFFTIVSKITRRQIVKLTADYISSNEFVK